MAMLKKQSTITTVENFRHRKNKNKYESVLNCVSKARSQIEKSLCQDLFGLVTYKTHTNATGTISCEILYEFLQKYYKFVNIVYFDLYQNMTENSINITYNYSLPKRHLIYLGPFFSIHKTTNNDIVRLYTSKENNNKNISTIGKLFYEFFFKLSMITNLDLIKLDDSLIFVDKNKLISSKYYPLKSKHNANIELTENQKTYTPITLKEKQLVRMFLTKMRGGNIEIYDKLYDSWEVLEHNLIDCQLYDYNKYRISKNTPILPNWPKDLHDKWIYAAMDKDGTIKLFTVKPTVDYTLGIWVVPNYDVLIYPFNLDTTDIDWANSISKR